MPTVEVSEAVCLLGNFPALAGASICVEAGELTLICGPNGAGKTTLLRLCAGLLPLASGRAAILGIDLESDRGALRRRIGLLGHVNHLYEDLTVEENVRLSVRAGRGEPDKVAAALERLGLVGRVRRTRASSLSSGQRRRTALAGLLARNPQVWLLDEPYSGLDPQGREILGEILAEVSSQGSTVMAVSHEPAGLAQLAHSVVTMGGGRILSKVFGPGPVPSVAVPDPSVAVPVPTPGEEPAGVA